ncbi:hypothetical protein J2W42_001245 [Rhizobium tibeticum]|uniref:hypothetical protein n=1 Tax=Rhizobium tibeticum TaxID=501024 RepID=UPI00278A5A0C|nr:hypothetical protein [Rhizobium tibeticum]MDP9808407.1 hypothetical protein [Rhizobium tibeticum]
MRRIADRSINDQRAAMSDLVVERLDALVAFTEEEATRGPEKYCRDIEQRHHTLCCEDIDCIRAHRS